MTNLLDAFIAFRKAVDDVAPGALVSVDLTNLPLRVITQYPSEDEDNDFGLRQRTEGTLVGKIMYSYPATGLEMESVLFDTVEKG